ncbi:D-alanyl-D-alanine carboxypeptidase, partial [Bifidobacterium longum]
MVSTAVSRRQRREAQRRTQRSHRRTLTVIISALTTIALFAGYCAADITDVAPGLLTLKPVTAPVFANPATAKSGGTIAGALNANKAIDSTAASALVNELLSAQGVGNDTSVIIEDA